MHINPPIFSAAHLAHHFCFHVIGGKQEVPVTLADQCTSNVQENIKCTGELMGPIKYFEEMHHRKRPSHAHGGRGDNATK